MFNQEQIDKMVEAVVKGELEVTGQPPSEARVKEFCDWCLKAVISSSLVELVINGLMDVRWDEESNEWGFRLKEQGIQFAEEVVRNYGMDPNTFGQQDLKSIYDLVMGDIEDVPDEKKN